MFKLPKSTDEMFTSDSISLPGPEMLEVIEIQKMLWLKNIEISQHGAYNTETEHTLSPWRKWQRLIVWKFPPSKGDADLQWTAVICWIGLAKLYSKYFYIGRENDFIY